MSSEITSTQLNEMIADAIRLHQQLREVKREIESLTQSYDDLFPAIVEHPKDEWVLNKRRREMLATLTLAHERARQLRKQISMAITALQNAGLRPNVWYRHGNLAFRLLQEAELETILWAELPQQGEQGEQNEQDDDLLEQARIALADHRYQEAMALSMVAIATMLRRRQDER